MGHKGGFKNLKLGKDVHRQIRRRGAPPLPPSKQSDGRAGLPRLPFRYPLGVPVDRVGKTVIESEQTSVIEEPPLDGARRAGEEKSNMPIPRRIREFLDTKGVPYQCWHHPLSYTAQGTAHAQHISGKDLAKVVMVMVSDRLAMAVLPGSHRLDLDRFGAVLGTGSARLATEEEFGQVFPDCEMGAMPPFGNLYDIAVWVDSSLRDHPNITFNAGTHEDTIQMSFSDFAKVVQPKEGSFGVLRH